MGLREDYLEKMEAQLKEWGAEIDKLKEKAADLKGGAKTEAKAKYDEVINLLIKNRDTVQGRITELRKSGDEAWVDLKVGLENAWEELKTALENAISKFK